MDTIVLIAFGIFLLIAFIFLACLTFKMFQWKTEQCVEEMKKHKEDILDKIENNLKDTFEFDDDDDEDDEGGDDDSDTFRPKNRIKRFLKNG